MRAATRILAGIGWVGIAAIAAAALLLGLSVWWPKARAVPTSPPAPTRALTLPPIPNTPAPVVYQIGLPNISVPAPTTELAQVALPTATEATPTALPFTPAPSKTAPPQIAAGNASGACEGIVTRAGDQLKLDGEPFHFLGTNAAYLMESYFPEREIEPILAFVGDTFPNAVLRIWVLPGNDLDRLERILDIGAEYGVRFMIAFDDYNRGRDEHWFQSTFRMDYLPHVQEVVKRFRDRPMIAVWELMNEPTCGSEGLSQSCLDAEYGWAKETSEAIKALDPCRPITVGTSGFVWGNGPDLDNFRRMHALPSIDLASIHKEVGKAEEYITEIVESVQKPWFFGEVYYKVYNDGCQLIRSGLLEERANAVEADIRASLDAGASGYLLWQYAAGAVDMGDKIQWFCGWYEYFRDDPAHARIRSTDWDLAQWILHRRDR